MFSGFKSRQFIKPKIIALDSEGRAHKKPLSHRPKSILVLGKHDRSDIVVTQGGVSDKHCVLRIVEEQIWIKALAPAYLNGQRLPDNEEVLWEKTADLMIGDQVFRLSQRLSAWVRSLMIMTAISLGCVAWVIAHQSVSEGGAFFSDDNLAVALDKAVMEPALPDMNKVADDVEEVFRLSGIPVSSVVDGQGVVTVIVNRGFSKDFSELIYSPAMLSIEGLHSIKLLVGAKNNPAGINGISGIRHMVNGSDKYLVGVDGSRYYRGAQLPGGETILALSEENIVLSMRGREQKISLSDIAVISPSFQGERGRYNCALEFDCLVTSRTTSSGFDDDIANAAQAFSVPASILKAVINVESAYNPSAVSPAGAIGLMQLMPDTAVRFGVKDPYDPAQNIMGGAKYLRFLMDRYDDDLTKVFAAYNAGEGAVDKYAGVPPYTETQNYVVKVRQALQSIEQI